MAASKTTEVIYTDIFGKNYRVAMTVAEWFNRPDELIDEYAYWYSPAVEANGMDPWALIDGVDEHADGDKFDLWFATSPQMLTVTGNFIIYVKPEHYALCTQQPQQSQQ